ncbi:hypothetical protein B566_EDAN018859 [Ephemera danica]|nr:hypothetical protein B566_EDAN018859 [Ephemera danica]
MKSKIRWLSELESLLDSELKDEGVLLFEAKIMKQTLAQEIQLNAGGMLYTCKSSGSAGQPGGERRTGSPRRRSVAGLRGRPATLELRHGPDSYGRQQWGILDNGRKPDPAIPRE